MSPFLFRCKFMLVNLLIYSNYKKLLEFLHTYNINDIEIIEINDNTFSNFGIILLEEGE